MTDPLSTPLQFIKGVGPRRGAALADTGLHVLEDLLLRLPSRYEDRQRLQLITDLKIGEATSIAGKVLSCGLRSTRRRGFQVFEALIEDSSGQIRAVFLNQPFLSRVFKVHQQMVLYGKVEATRSGSGLQFTNPKYEGIPEGVRANSDKSIHTGRIVPIYERVGTITSKMFRRIIHAGIQQLPDQLSDPIPAGIRERLALPGRREALEGVHFPEPESDIEELNAFLSRAQRRLIFEEFFAFQVGLVLRRLKTEHTIKTRRIKVDDRVRHSVLQVLPFRLTDDQKKALKEIVRDLEGVRPMNRLLQGDVGSGKTIVALIAALVAMENNVQVALMSPTEVLAEQHFFNLKQLLSESRFETALLTGAMGAQDRRRTWELIASGGIQLVVGTHALMEEAVDFKNLGLVVIDEQHRFGVLQRARLRSKGTKVDVLVMTATPIPRTLALTAYGDLDISVIRELPPGRVPITTHVKDQSQRQEVYAFIASELAQGRQGYVVCPLVEESEKVDVRAAIEMASDLERIFTGYNIGLVHGRMASDEREQTMKGFTEGAIDLLVATTIIEVGVDVPNASFIVVEHADRFGLAQLHQLRGRVGRGSYLSHCILLRQHRVTEMAQARLDVIAATSDGFEIAERDLGLRGPGDFFGTRQSGMPILRVGDLMRDHRLMEEARQTALTWVETGGPSKDKLELVLRGWSDRFGLVAVG